MTMLKKVFSHKKPLFFSLLIAIIFGVFFVAAWWANTDLTEGRFALYMDERITFDGVKKILHPEGVKSFLHAVFDGGDHRYGRSLWNSIALFSFIPEKLWGDTGQLVATRTFQVLLLFAAFLIFAFGLIRSWPLRLFLLVSLLAMPYAEYFMTMPKPEPLQLFFLALFFFFHSKRSLGYDWHYLFLGLAFGTKISILPAVVVIVTVSLLAANAYHDRADLWLKMKKAVVFFLLGLGVAVPILLPAILAGIIVLSIELSSLKTIYQWLPLVVKLPALFFVMNFFKGGIKTWFHTVLAVSGLKTFGASIESWIRFIVNEWFVAAPRFHDMHIGVAINPGVGVIPQEVGLADPLVRDWAIQVLNEWFIASQVFIITIFVIIFLFVVLSFISRSKEKWYRASKDDIGFLLFSCGIALVSSIFFATDRIWGHYLFPGVALVYVGLFVLLDQAFFDKSRTTNRFLLKWRKHLSKTVVLLVVLFAGLFWVPVTLSNLKVISHRTQGPSYTEQKMNYRLIVDFFEKKSATTSKKFVIAYYPRFFLPQSTDRYQVVEYWDHSFFAKFPDIIVLFKSETSNAQIGPEYGRFFRESYTKYVIKEKRYRVAKILPNGGEILELVSPTW